MTCQKADGESMAQKIIGARWPVSWFGSVPRKSPFLPVVIVPSFCKMETSIEISSPLRLQKKSSNSQVWKKCKGALTYPVGPAMLHGYSIYKEWPCMSNACIVMWHNFGQNIPTGLSFSIAMSCLSAVHPEHWRCQWVLIPIIWRNLTDEAQHLCTGLPAWHCHSLLQECSVAEPCNTRRELQHILIVIHWHRGCTGLLNS